jgi:hypothetical protein
VEHSRLGTADTNKIFPIELPLITLFENLLRNITTQNGKLYEIIYFAGFL